MTPTRKAPRSPFDGVSVLVRESIRDAMDLRAIVDGEPDTKLTPALNKAVPRLAKRKWLQVCGCSDGDYVRITDLGQRILEKIA